MRSEEHTSELQSQMYISYLLNTPTFTLLVSQKKREKVPKKIFEEIIAENFPNTGKERVIQVQEA